MIGGIIAATAGHRRAVGSLDPDAQLYINAMTTPPSGARQTLINQLFLDLKAAGAFALLDEMWLPAAHDPQASPLGIKRYKDCTVVNAPAWVADRGYTGAATQYLNTNFNPLTDGMNYTLNSSCAFAYCRTDVLADGAIIGARETSPLHDIQLLPRAADGKMYGNLHTPELLANIVNIAVADTLGLFCVRRSALNAQQVLRNAVELASNAAVSDTIPNLPLFILARNNAGTPGVAFTGQVSCAGVGAAMTIPQQLALFTAVETYLDAIGAGVVA